MYIKQSIAYIAGPYGTIHMPQVGFEPPIPRECLLEFDIRSNYPSHHGWLQRCLFHKSDKRLGVPIAVPNTYPPPVII